MRVTVDQLTLLLNELRLPPEVRARLLESKAELRLSDGEVRTLNDVCAARVQEAGFKPDGSANELGQTLERIIDVLNAE